MGGVNSDVSAPIFHEESNGTTPSFNSFGDTESGGGRRLVAYSSSAVMVAACSEVFKKVEATFPSLAACHPKHPPPPNDKL